MGVRGLSAKDEFIELSGNTRRECMSYTFFGVVVAEVRFSPVLNFENPRAELGVNRTRSEEPVLLCSVRFLFKLPNLGIKSKFAKF